MRAWTKGSALSLPEIGTGSVTDRFSLPGENIDIIGQNKTLQRYKVPTIEPVIIESEP